MSDTHQYHSKLSYYIHNARLLVAATSTALLRLATALPIVALVHQLQALRAATNSTAKLCAWQWAWRVRQPSYLIY